MTNKQKWDEYTSGLSSPQNMVDWGFRYLIAASLQRRVWCPPEHRKCFPNMYPVLVGKPGIGKGNVIRSVYDILGHHKLDETAVAGTPTAEEKATMAAIIEADIKAATESTNQTTSNEKPALIPTAADAVTYEALVKSMASAYRRINYSEYSEKHGRHIMKIYGHSSLAFCLEEMASLFRKNTESMVNFLIQAYDCGDKYEYRTKTSGIDRVLRLCLNFLAGTTPDFMQEVFDDRLLSQGFSSRAFFIYASKNRKSQFFIPGLTPAQEKYREELRTHVKELTRLYGQVDVENSTIRWLEDWWEKYENNPTLRASPSSKLEAYYSRKNIHVMKVAMALHFGESLEMRMDKKVFENAMEVLHQEEKTMHLALAFTGVNPLSRLSQRVLDLLRGCPRTYSDLLIECYSLGTRKELDEVLEYLAMTDQIRNEKEVDQDTNVEIVYWKLKSSTNGTL